MLTRKKEMSGSLREKRGTSPSPSSSTLRRATSSSSSKTVSTSRSLDSSPSEKSIPNYLKPTLSSAGDTTKLQAKKPVSSTDSSALRLARRRSFDKPPSPTRTLKTRGVSPTPTFRSSSFSSPPRTLKTRGVSPTPTFRSSSFSGKTTTTSPKGERSLKKQPSLYARAVGTVKKSSTLLGKKAETSRKDPKLDNVSELSDQQESPIAEAEQQMVSEHEDEETQEMDEDTITQQLEAEIQKVDSPTFLEEDDDDTAKTILEETDDHVRAELHDSSNTNSEQHDADANAAKVESLKSSEHGEEPEEISSQLQEVKEHTSSTNPNEEAEENERDEDESTEEVEAVVEDENAAPKEAHGKKDLGLSNNVIEETANMLREQRRNKVKALAGAFETVISLQDK